MRNPFIQKLDRSGFLTEADREILEVVPIHARQVQKSVDLIREGDRPETVIVVLDGFACRYKMMPRGRRHIMALLVPGDICDLQVALLRHMDHGILHIVRLRIGLSTVHINRSLQDLRANELVSLKGKRVDIPDVEKLKAYCSFNANYLHLMPR